MAGLAYPSDEGQSTLLGPIDALSGQTVSRGIGQLMAMLAEAKGRAQGFSWGDQVADKEGWLITM